MILLVDAGNTRVKWRVVCADAPARALAEGAVGHAEIDMLAAACRSGGIDDVVDEIISVD